MKIRFLTRRRLLQGFFLLAMLGAFVFVAGAGGAEVAAEGPAAKYWPLPQWALLADGLGLAIAAVASRTWQWLWPWPLAVGGAVLAATLVLGRVFCGYVCPLGTLIDLCGALRGPLKLRGNDNKRAWRHIEPLRYVLLAVLAGGAVAGVSLLGLSAIALMTRGLAGGWQLAAGAVSAAALAGAGLLVLAVGASLAERRFWCRYVCPTGALLSLAGLVRRVRRRVSGDCVSCGRCVKACDFGAVADDFGTLQARCTLCGQCKAACPAGAIGFGLDGSGSPVTTVAGMSLSRRHFLSAGVGGVAAAIVLPRLVSAGGTSPMLRPPGSVEEETFRDLCLRCGLCVKACPTGTLGPAGMEGGLGAMWTPRPHFDRSGCRPDCNLCGQVCPTGAIRRLSLEQKQSVRMGLAVVNEGRCLPASGKAQCLACLGACAAAGHNAIDRVLAHPELDEMGMPVEDTGMFAPMVDERRCVGCGLCQAACHKTNVAAGKLGKSAIVVNPLGR